MKSKFPWSFLFVVVVVVVVAVVVSTFRHFPLKTIGNSGTCFIAFSLWGAKGWVQL